MPEQKTYVPKCSAKKVSDNLLKLSFNAAALRDFLSEHVNERGYLNICISPRKEVGQFGDTHSVWLDTWKPDPNKQKQQPPQQRQPAPPPQPSLPGAEQDGVPF